MTLSRRVLLLSGLTLSTLPACQPDPDLSVQRQAALVGPVYVQGGWAAPQTNQTAVSVTLRSPQGAGNLLVVFAGWNDTTATVSAVSDSVGDRFSLAVGPTRRTMVLSQSIYYANNIAGGANTVTVRFSRAATFVDIRVLEYAGLDALAPFDSAAAASGSSGQADTGLLTTQAAGDLLVAGDMVLTGSPTAGSGYTVRLTTMPDDDIAQDRIAGAPGTYNATAPVVAPNGWVIQVAAFKPANGSLGTGGSGTGGSGAGGSGAGGTGTGGSGTGGSGIGGTAAGGSGVGGTGSGGMMTSGTGGSMSGTGGMTSGSACRRGTGPGTTQGPLHVSTVNRRYFADWNNKIVYLTGSHTWGNFRDRGLTDPPAPFDFDQYLDFLVSHNHDFIRLWAWEQAHSFNNNLDQLKRYFTPFPWQRTGPGTANDGKPKFDFTKYDQSFFDRLRARVIAAAARGIYVSVMLFDGWDVANACNPTDGGFPYGEGNNINGISADCTDTQILAIAAVTQIQDAYVRKVIDTVNDLDNVLYEIANETNGGAISWQYHMIDLVKQYESTKPCQHPVGMTTPGGGDDPDIIASQADWISPVNPLMLSDGTKVVLNDTDHSYYWTTLESNGPGDQRAWAWKTLTLGASPLFMDPYLEVWPVRNNPSGNTPDPYWDVLRDALGNTRRYAERIDLAHDVPSGSLCSTGYCLANPGTQYLVYQPSSAAFTVTMLAGAYTFEWYNPQTGTVAQTGTLSVAAGNVTFTPPFSGDAVLLLSH